MSDTPLLDRARHVGSLRKSAQASSAMLAPLMKSLSAQMAAELTAPVGVNWMSHLAKPLVALGISAGLFGAGEVYQSARSAGVESEVVKRFKDEFMLGGRRDESDWKSSNIESKVRGVYRDLKAIAPDVAALTPAALGAVRPVALRESPNFSSEEIRSLAEAQGKLRDVKPMGSHALRTVESIFKMTPDIAGTGI